MFNNKSFDVVGFESCWKTERSTESTDAQTVPCSSEQKESQTVTSCSVEVQTDPPPSCSDVDYDKLSIFLKRVCPSVLLELDKIQQSRSANRAEDLDRSYEAAKILHVFHPKREEDENIKMKVSNITWSCSGSSLAFGLCALKHENWCNHNNRVVFYNINRQDLSPNIPTTTMVTSSCVTQVSFHPLEPSVIAVGMFSGEVLVWNLQRDDDNLLGSSANIPGGHRDAVTQLTWMQSHDPTQTSVSLVSAGRDGQILLWHVASHTGIFRISEGFAISLDHGVHGGKVRTPISGGVDNELGVTCFSFASHERSSFIVGVEGGCLLKCSLLTSKPASVNSAIPLKDPVLFSYQGHQGNVTSIQCSTSSEPMFVTCGIDREIHLYNCDQPTPVKVIFADTTYVGLAWCPVNSRLFSAWGESGSVDFYSIIKGEKIPSLTLQTEGKHSISTACFNQNSGRLLAHGDMDGNGTVWQLPHLQSYRDSELSAN